MEAKFSTKTAQLLYDILPEEVEVVSKFDKIRKKLKLCKTRDNLLEDTYMVKIINKEDKLKSEITNMEQHLWHKDVVSCTEIGNGQKLIVGILRKELKF